MSPGEPSVAPTAATSDPTVSPGEPSRAAAGPAQDRAANTAVKRKVEEDVGGRAGRIRRAVSIDSEKGGKGWAVSVSHCLLDPPIPDRSAPYVRQPSGAPELSHPTGRSPGSRSSTRSSPREVSGLSLPPVLFLTIYRLNPQYIGILFTDPLGKQLIAVAVFLQILGALVIKKIINIKV